MYVANKPCISYPHKRECDEEMYVVVVDVAAGDDRQIICMCVRQCVQMYTNEHA